MDQNDEKFFEQLSGAKETADGTYDVELAKASSGVLSTASTARPKVIKTEERADETWNDGEPEGQLTVDVYQTATEIVVESAIAGVKADDIDVNVTADSISI